ncbi:MAG: efflux RND transporter periplasmic adaptor subunit [Acidobacteria bacterium]|nr:efflux RND transporter periplasmic adaptor subunit [Acidobacteriota bacterium]
MSENKISEQSEHHAGDEAELDRLESNLDQGEPTDAEPVSRKTNPVLPWIITVAVVGLIAIIGIAWIINKNSASGDKATAEEHKEEPGHSEDENGKEVKLDPEMLASAGIVTEAVTQRPAIARLMVTGAVELNPETTEMATALVGGRIEKVYYGVGDNVQKGAVLAVISSPQLAQMHGKMHEAKTKFELAQRNLTRVQRSENRVAVLQAKAKLDEADATLKRTKRLIELGAGAGKDLITAETIYRTAKADYEFQTNIALNKELQEAKADVETSRVDLKHIQDELRSLGVPVDPNEADDHRSDTSLVSVRSPLSGVVTERKFNAGAGIEAAMPIFSISNLGTVYVIANVAEASMARLRVGSVAEITSPAIGTVSGRVSYIDPQLDETTRTGRVRLEVPNSNGKLRAGMFAEVGFYTGTNEATGEELVVPSGAVQRTADKTIVFVPRDDEPGAFEVREIEAGADINGYTKIIEGLKLGEKVVTKGSFTLKTQLEKGAMGDDH